MSLQSLLFGYSGECGCLESVEPELMARYGCASGPVVMAMEAADMLHDIYMESFYDTNDLEISAAMEGVSVLTEASEKGSTFKEKISSAWEKLKELFHKFVEMLKGIFGSIVNAIKNGIGKAKDFIKNIPGNIKSRLSKLEYEGFKYTNLDNYAKFASKVDISSKNYKKMTDRVADVAVKAVLGRYDNKPGDVSTDSDKTSFAEDMSDALNKSLLDVKKMFGIGDDDKTEDVSKILFAYFRNGAKDADDKTKQTISVHDAETAVNNSEKDLSILNKLFSGLQADYEYAAERCKLNQKRIKNGGSGGDLRQMSVLVNAQRQIASYSNMMNNFVSTVTNAWKTALTERNNVYCQAIAKAAASESKKED